MGVNSPGLGRICDDWMTMLRVPTPPGAATLMKRPPPLLVEADVEASDDAVRRVMLPMRDVGVSELRW